MSNISSIQNIQTIQAPHNIAQSASIKTSLLEIAKSALSTTISQAQGVNVATMLQQNSMEVTFLQNNASQALKQEIAKLNTKQEVTKQELSALYFENGQLRNHYDLFLADIVTATVLMKNIKLSFDENKFSQELQIISDNLQKLVLATDKISAQKYADVLDSIFEQLESQALGNAKEHIDNLRSLLDKKMEYLQRVNTLQNAVQESAEQGKFAHNFPSEINNLQITSDNIFGIGALAFAEEKLSAVFEELQLSNLLQHLILNNESDETVESLYAKADEKAKVVIENFSTNILQELKNSLQINSLSEIFSILSNVNSFSQRIMLEQDSKEILNELQEKELQLCKEFITNNQGNSNLITAENAHIVGELLEKNAYSQAILSLLTNENSLNGLLSLRNTELLTKQEKSDQLRTIIAKAQEAGLGLEELVLTIETVSNDNEILNETTALASYLLLQPLLKENNILSAYTVNTINFTALKESIEVLMQSDIKEKSFNNYIGLFINSAFLLYKAENALSIDQARKVDDFINAFSSEVQERIKDIVNKQNINIFHAKFDANLAKSILYATSYGLNSRILYSALRSFDDKAKFDPAVRMINAGFQKLIGIDSLGNFSKADLLGLAKKQMQNSSLIQNNARLEEINLAQALIRGEYENIISSKEFLNLMQVQKITKPENISGETLATSINLLQRFLAKDLKDLSNYQLAKLGLTREEIDSSYLVKQAVYNATDHVKNSFEYALLIANYFVMTNKTDSQSQEAVLTAIEANTTIREYIKFLGLSDKEKRSALEGLAINGHLFVDLAKFQTSTVNFKNQNKQGVALKNNLSIITSAKTSEDDKNTARQEIIKLLQGTETQPLTVWADSVLAVKKHDSVDNTKSFALALDKTIRTPHSLLQEMGKLYTKDKLFHVNLTDKTQRVEKQIDTERNVLLSDYDKSLLDSCMKVALGLACVEFDYADYRIMLRDYATKQHSFSELDKAAHFKTYMQEVFLELGIDQSVVSGLVDYIVFHSLDTKERIDQQISILMEKVRTISHAFSSFSATGKMENLVSLYKSSMNILEDLEQDQSIYIDGKTGMSLEVEQIQAGIDMANIFSIQRNAHNEPVVKIGSGFIGEFGIDFELHEAVSATAKINANAMGVLSLTFESDTDASIFMAKVLSRLADKFDLFYAKNASVGSQFGAGATVSAELNIASLVGFDYADFGFGVEASGSGSYFTVRGTKENETHLKGAYTLSGEVRITLSDSVKELAENPINVAQSMGIPNEFSKSKTFAVEKELIGITDIFNKQLTKLIEEHTLLESLPAGINLFGKKHQLTQEQITQLLEYYHEHKEEGMKIKVRYAYDIDTTNANTSIANQMKKALSANSRQLQSCSVFITTDDNDKEFELPYNIVGITFGIHQNYQAIKTREIVV